jgi:hypothetical protein
MLFNDAVRCEYYVASVIDEQVWELYWQKKTTLVWEKKKTILVWNKNLSQYHYVCPKSHMDWPVIQPELPPSERPPNNHLSHDTANSTQN